MTPHRRRLAALALFLLAAAGLAAPPRPALAITLLERDPKVTEIMTGPGLAFALRFDQPVDHRRSSLRLEGGSFSRSVPVRLEAEPQTLYGNLGRVPPGDYELLWTARARDGTMCSGRFPITVR